jgi:phosphoribosylformylglycinamidine (FGAM) synthase PurS component
MSAGSEFCNKLVVINNRKFYKGKRFKFSMEAHKDLNFKTEQTKISQEEIEKRILRVLKFGKENAIKSPQIAKMIGIEITNTNQKLRKACKDLLLNDICTILSSEKGFYKAKDQEEVKEYIINLQKMRAGIERDIDCLNECLQI